MGAKGANAERLELVSESLCVPKSQEEPEISLSISDSYVDMPLRCSGVRNPGEEPSNIRGLGATAIHQPVWKCLSI